MHKEKTKVTVFIPFLLAVVLTSCTRASDQPVLTSWSEQYTSAKKIVQNLGNEFVLVQVVAQPVRREASAPEKPIELKTTLLFESLKSTGATYDTQIVEYNDHHLATTLTVSDVAPRQYAPEPASLEQASLLRMSPHDALQLTLTEGEAYLGSPVEYGNTDIHLVWDVSEDQPELQNASAPVWQVIYYRQNSTLNILIDAQTGEILKQYEE